MARKNEKRLRRYPYFLALLVIGGISAAVQVLVILDCIWPTLQYTADAVCNVMSTCSEVVAGLYGITLTGYIFFADRFRDNSNEDESLYDAIQALLLRYNHMAGIISLMCLVCILAAEGIVLYGGNTILPEGAYHFIVDETLLLFFVTFNFILYFVISVLDPQKVSRISAQKKEKLSTDKKIGDGQKFLEDWNAIEDKLYVMGENLIKSIRLVPTSKNKPQMIRNLEMLRNYGRIGNRLWRDLEKLRQYHNLVVHSPNMTVSQEMCDLAQKVRTELETKT